MAGFYGTSDKVDTIINTDNFSGTDGPPDWTPDSILTTVFGYDSFRGQQRKIIDQLLNGGNALVLMPTGGGKSLCYQIPALLRKGVGIVISPLIALMQDQVGALAQLGIKAEFLNSTLTPEQAEATERRLIAGKLDLLYLAPERLTVGRTFDLFKHVDIALFAIDEAHCVSQWGHDFRVDYLRLSMLHRHFPDVPRIALTATATRRTRIEIKKELRLDGIECVSSFDRPNICYRIVPKQRGKIREMQPLLKFIRTGHSGETGIVYCLTRKKVEATADWLQGQGINALPYHAGMDNETRQHHLRRFLMEEGQVMVATIAFGMGIDKPNVRYVAHLDQPMSVEAYYQETGRAGRDGKKADAILWYCREDYARCRWILGYGVDREAAQYRYNIYKLDTMLSFCEQVNCRRQALLAYFGEQAEPCGNCDACIEHIPSSDISFLAAIIIDVISSIDKPAPDADMIVDVLTNSPDYLDKILSMAAKAAPVDARELNLARAANEWHWRMIIRHMAHVGLLTIDVDNDYRLGIVEGGGGCRISQGLLPGDGRIRPRRPKNPGQRKKNWRVKRRLTGTL